MQRPKKHLSFGSLVEALRNLLNSLEDQRDRNRIRYPLSDIGLSAFACMFFQDPSMLSFEKRMQDEHELCNFNSLFGVSRVPESTQLRDVLDLRQHPQLEIILLGDSLFSKHPMVELARAKRMDFIFTAKPGDHKYLFEWRKNHPSRIKELRVVKEKGVEHVYNWVERAPLESAGKSYVNFFELEIFATDKKTKERKRTFRSSWVTSLPLNETNIQKMTAAARARWKIENQCFNNLKNQGYCLEHNFGHGSEHLAFNFYILTLLAFLFHQVFELTDSLYQTVRAKWSLRMLWENLRGVAYNFQFTSWEQLVTHCLHPPKIPSPIIV